MQRLKDIPIFKGIPDDVLGFLSPIVREETFPPGALIFEEGAPSDRFFIIKRGEVEIHKQTSSAEDLHKLIAVLVSGEFFGEMGLFMAQPRTARAMARGDVTLFSISREALAGLISKSPEAAFTMMGFLSSVLMERLHNTTRELAAVYETGRRAAAAHSTGELAQTVLEGLFDAVHAQAGFLVLWNEFNMDFEVVGARGIELEVSREIPDDDPVLAHLRASQEPFVSFDLAMDMRLACGTSGVCSGGRSMVAAPFFHRGRMLGFIVLVNNEKSGAFSYNHMVLLSAIGGYVSVAVENLSFMQEAVDRARLSQAKSSIRPF